MKILEFLQGKWLGHPLHPALVHLPVGAWLGACALDLVVRFGAQNPGLARLALYCVGTGLVFALLAVPPGVADWSGIKKEKPAWKLGLYHMIGNAIAALVWCVNLGLRVRALGTVEPVNAPVLFTSVLATVIVVSSAYLGKLMVFDHGISVARESKKKWRAIAERGGARLPPAK
jgi:uncharacterized membrane protein